MNGKLPLTLLAVAALAFACGPRTRNEASSTTRATGSANATGTASPSPSPSPLTPSFDVAVEDGVRFAFHVVNDGSKKLEVNFNDGRTHEIVVLDSVGKEVWRWSNGRLFTQAMQNKVLRTSDSLRYKGSWTEAKPGTYVAVATLASENFPVSRRVEFTVR